MVELLRDPTSFVPSPHIAVTSPRWLRVRVIKSF